jgi:hypothetical protein
VIFNKALDIIPDNISGLGTALSYRQVPCYIKRNDGSLYFEYPIVLSIIIISARGFIIGKEVILTLIVVQVIAI